MLGPCLIVEIEMAKQRDAAMFDLFDQAAAKSQIGERQLDLEDLIAASLFDYRCVHYREHFYDCRASSTYDAAKIAAAHWGRNNTCGIDVYRLYDEKEF